LVLEDLEYALARGAAPLAELVGYAATSDAIHIAAPDADGRGAAMCMTLAMRRAGVSPEQVSYINAHGTSTQLGDPAETRAIKEALGEHAWRVPVSATKSMTGHLVGCAGALEAVISIQALRTGIIPPTINLHTPDPACDLDYVPNQAREADLEVVLSNSFGFGGHNGTLVFRRYA
jgi:3-oxoacyl-(acyl-carrier-protein) synthase